MATQGKEQLSVFIYCIYMLVYRYAVALIEEMLTQDD